MPDLNSALFLDRDGVINRQIVGDYVRNLSQLELLPDAMNAIARLGRLFRYVLVVTNQQGIGKGLMSAEDVAKIHDHIIREATMAGGRIDRIYCCPSLEAACDPNRKPDVGMGWQAKVDFPDINFRRSLMIGDSPSDMLFAERLGMKRVFIGSGKSACRDVQHVYRSLAEIPENLPTHIFKYSTNQQTHP
jgi:histidinol-phosphate phosphatase family protein